MLVLLLPAIASQLIFPFCVDPIISSRIIADPIAKSLLTSLANLNRLSLKNNNSAVRFGRVPKREKARLVEEMARASARSLIDALVAELEDEGAVLEACDAAFATLAHTVNTYASGNNYTTDIRCPLRLSNLKCISYFYSWIYVGTGKNKIEGLRNEEAVI